MLEVPQPEECCAEVWGADVVIGPQSRTRMSQVGELLLGSGQGEWRQVGASAEKVQHRATGSRDPDGFGGDGGGWVDPFLVGGDEDDHVVTGDAAGFVEA